MKKIITLCLALAMTLGMAAFAPAAPTDPTDLAVGDTVSFGRYPQASLGRVADVGVPDGVEGVDWIIANAVSTKGPQGPTYYAIAPIVWRVLAIENEEALLVSDKILDSLHPYNTTSRNVTWETCSLRTWLNDASAGFISKAFSAEEQAQIAASALTTPNNTTWGTPGGNNTSDKVFLLSLPELQTLIGTNNVLRRPNTTAYAAYTNTEMIGAEMYNFWLLRTPGQSAAHTMTISNIGGIDTPGVPVNSARAAVRPALRMKLVNDPPPDYSDATFKIRGWDTPTVSIKYFPLYLWAEFTPPDTPDQRIIWTSSNPAVASVDRDTGVVQGHKQGSVVITAVSVANGYMQKLSLRILF